MELSMTPAILKDEALLARKVNEMGLVINLLQMLLEKWRRCCILHGKALVSVFFEYNEVTLVQESLKL